MLPVSRTTTTAAQTFRFTLAPGLSLGVGQYSSNRFQVELFTPDADGLELPDIANFPSGHVVTINGVDYTLNADATSYDDFGTSTRPDLWPCDSRTI